MDHDTFMELAWKRDPVVPSIFQVPSGFITSIDPLGDEFLSIVQDIRALQTIRDDTDIDGRDAVTIMHFDNHQASIESRLYNLGHDPLRFENPVLYCCILSAHVCTYMLFTEIWDASVIPLFLAYYLLEQLEYAHMEGHMLEHWDLFVWIICVGGTFVDPGGKQTEYAVLLKRQMRLKPSGFTERDLQMLLQSFIWSEKTFGKRWTRFLAQCEDVFLDECENN